MVQILDTCSSVIDAAMALYTYICGSHPWKNKTIMQLISFDLSEKIKAHYLKKKQMQTKYKKTKLWQYSGIEKEAKSVKALSAALLMKKLIPQLGRALNKCEEELVKDVVSFHQSYPRFQERTNQVSSYAAALKSLITRDAGMTNNDATIASSMGVTAKLTETQRRDTNNLPSTPSRSATILNKNQFS